MKTHRNLILLLFVFVTTSLTAQTYFDIEYAGANDIIPTTILVQNLTKGTSVNMQGTDTLRLNAITSVQQVEIEKNKLKIYPSPMEQYCYVEFLNAQQGRVEIQMLTMDGKLLYQSSKELPQGKHKFRIFGVSGGMYVLSVKTATDHITGHFISKGQSGTVLDMMSLTEISANKSDQNTIEANSLKQNIQAENNSSVVNMDYTIGDNLSFLGSATGYVNQTIYVSPTGSQSLTFFLTKVVEVYNPATGMTWMDRNLGASWAAISSTDSQSYGDLYQWGRETDGHEKRNSPTTSTLSSSDKPCHGNFILVSSAIHDWRSPQNDNLWQGENGINNPCPDGFRIPTLAEWVSERASWSSNNSVGAFGSPLKLSVTGYRMFGTGTIVGDGSFGYYWSSTINGTMAQFLNFYSGNAQVSNYYREYGMSVRCLKEGVTVSLPTVSTGEIREITSTTASGGGNITSDGGATITARGVVWSTAENPVVSLTSKTNDGSGIGLFTSLITDLSPSTTYYVRAYATNGVGTAYGSQVSFTTSATSTVSTVYNPTTGKTWMDRNLGASRVATSIADDEAYGDLYQWGRNMDGHEKRNSPTTSTLSSSDIPGHGSFILISSGDWRNPKNDNLWQGVNGVNNPCPDGFRIPTAAEWDVERASWSGRNWLGAFESQLKLPVAGYRDNGNGLLYNVGSVCGQYWSSTVDGTMAKFQYFSSGFAYVSSTFRAFGNSVRCIKD